MKIAIITQANEHQIAIDTPYNPEWLDEFKSVIHYTNRKWGGKDTGWLVDNGLAGKALEITAKHFTIQDRRGKDEDEIIKMSDTVEDATLEAEIAQIQANQAYIKEHTGTIEQIIHDLDVVIARYSYRSKSRVKGAYAQDRALLAHSLTNANQPLESLVEVQVRGLAAAVRLLQKKQISYSAQVIRW